MNSKRTSNVLLLLFSFMLIAPACTEEPENVKELLPGRWELQHAMRDGQPTRSLTDLYYEFDGEGKMQTNLPVAQGESAYTISGMSIEQEQNGSVIAYTVESISDTSLVLTTELRDTRFQFNLQRVAPEQ